MFCTSCGNELSEIPVIDVLVTRYRCPKGHLFYRMKTDPADHIPNPSLVKEPAGVDDRQLIEFWLSNPRARREMSHDLGALCRGLIDREMKLDVEPQRDFWPRPVLHCFLCGRPSPRHGDDLYMDGYRCDAGHQVWERSGDLNVTEPPDQRMRKLSIEPNPWFIAGSADNWIADADHTTGYISPALRDAIRRLRPTLGPADPPGVTRSEGNPSRLRSLAAIFAGYMVFTVTSVALFTVAGQDPHLPASDEFMLIGTIYGMVFGLIAGAVAAKLAPRRKVFHAMVVAGVIVIGAATSLMLQPSDAARWSQVNAILFMAPATFAGGFVGKRF